MSASGHGGHYEDTVFFSAADFEPGLLQQNVLPCDQRRQAVHGDGNEAGAVSAISSGGAPGGRRQRMGESQHQLPAKASAAADSGAAASNGAAGDGAPNNAGDTPAADAAQQSQAPAAATAASSSGSEDGRVRQVRPRPRAKTTTTPGGGGDATVAACAAALLASVGFKASKAHAAVHEAAAARRPGSVTRGAEATGGGNSGGGSAASRHGGEGKSVASAPAPAGAAAPGAATAVEAATPAAQAAAPTAAAPPAAAAAVHKSSRDISPLCEHLLGLVQSSLDLPESRARKVLTHALHIEPRLAAGDAWRGVQDTFGLLRDLGFSKGYIAALLEWSPGVVMEGAKALQGRLTRLGAAMRLKRDPLVQLLARQDTGVLAATQRHVRGLRK